MKLLRAYAALSVLVGILQVVDGVLLSSGALSVANFYIAAVELLWIPVSFAFFVVALIVRRHAWIPGSFLLYVAWGFAYGVYSLGQVGPENLVTPVAAVSGLLFGLFFAFVNVWSFRQGRGATRAVRVEPDRPADDDENAGG